LPPVAVPAEVQRLVGALESRWNDAKALAPLFTEQSVMIDSRSGTFTRGREAVAARVAEIFARPFRIVPISFGERQGRASLGAYLSRGEGSAAAPFGQALLTLAKGPDGSWLVETEALKFPGPVLLKPSDAADLVKLLDEAGIGRAVVLSVAYGLASPLGAKPTEERAKVMAENDWTAAQAERFPTRLIPFCSVNPLSDYAVAEIDRCAAKLKMRGLKLHFGNSNADVKNPEHVAKVRAVFSEANRLRLPIVAHLWTLDRSYGRKDAEIFLAQLLPAAPDVIVQIAHMAGGGPGWTDEALEVYANAVAAHDPRTRNLYFDVATVADGRSQEQLELLARRIRQIGPKRILYGSDAAFGGRMTARQEWINFYGMVPLSRRELETIARNVAPYLR
jgi:predicted TIM-barrel fold metal-dependent hydrolase